jgi:hypothetical protein
MHQWRTYVQVTASSWFYGMDGPIKPGQDGFEWFCPYPTAMSSRGVLERMRVPFFS